MGTSLPTAAVKTNSDSIADDPQQALLVDLVSAVDYSAALNDALGAAALYNIAEGLGTTAQADGTPDDLRVEAPVSGKTTAYTITTTDRGKVIRATGAGFFTLSFTAVATLGDGWFCYVRNDATGTVTLDPNSTEQIDGATTIKLESGQACMVHCNGSLLTTLRSWDVNSLEDAVGGSPVGAIDTANDKLVIYDVSEGRTKSVTPDNIGLPLGKFVKIISTPILSSVATVDFDNIFDGSYPMYLMVITNLHVVSNSGPLIQVGHSGGPTYVTSSYAAAGVGLNSSGTAENNNGGATTGLFLTSGTNLGSGANSALHATIWIPDPNNTTYPPHMYGQSVYNGTVAFSFGGGWTTPGTAINSLRVEGGAANMDDGVITIYGLTEI